MIWDDKLRHTSKRQSFRPLYRPLWPTRYSMCARWFGLVSLWNHSPTTDSHSDCLRWPMRALISQSSRTCGRILCRAAMAAARVCPINTERERARARESESARAPALHLHLAGVPPYVTIQHGVPPVKVLPCQPHPPLRSWARHTHTHTYTFSADSNRDHRVLGTHVPSSGIRVSQSYPSMYLSIASIAYSEGHDSSH